MRYGAGVRLRPSSKKPIKIAKAKMSSGNVFRDLGLHESGERLAKAQLANLICDAIADLKLTQTEAAKRMRLDQPKVSALLRESLPASRWSGCFAA